MATAPVRKEAGDGAASEIAVDSVRTTAAPSRKPIRTKICTLSAVRH